MYLPTYIFGALYIMRSIFRFSEYTTKYLFDKNIPIRM